MKSSVPLRLISLLAVVATVARCSRAQTPDRLEALRSRSDGDLEQALANTGSVTLSFTLQNVSLVRGGEYSWGKCVVDEEIVCSEECFSAARRPSDRLPGDVEPDKVNHPSGVQPSCGDVCEPLRPEGTPTVSYTHLRAHETDS